MAWTLTWWWQLVLRCAYRPVSVPRVPLLAPQACTSDQWVLIHGDGVRADLHFLPQPALPLAIYSTAKQLSSIMPATPEDKPTSTFDPKSYVRFVKKHPQWCIFFLLIAAILIWMYLPTISHLAGRWSNEDDYSHGFFVPLFSIALLWIRRPLFPSTNESSTTAVVAGVVLLFAGAAFRWASGIYFSTLLDALSLLPILAGITLVTGGWRALNWAWPAIFFLGFMIPLPGVISDRLSHPLQRIGTIGSTYLLQTVGVPAISEGNVIWLTEGQIGVVEACSGLRMLNVFFAITVGAAFIVKRPLWEKLLIAMSAVGIGVAVNVLRITATGIAHEVAGAEVADMIFHDLAGWLMMPLAILILMAECWFLSRLFIEPSTEPLMIPAHQNAKPAS